MIFGIISSVLGIAAIAIPFIIPSMSPYKILFVIGGILLLALGLFLVVSDRITKNREAKTDLVVAESQSDPGIFAQNTSTQVNAYATCQVDCREAHSGIWRKRARNNCLEGCNSFLN